MNNLINLGILDHQGGGLLDHRDGVPKAFRPERPGVLSELKGQEQQRDQDERGPDPVRHLGPGAGVGRGKAPGLAAVDREALEEPGTDVGRGQPEELGIEVIACAPFLQLCHSYDDRTVDLEFFLVDEWRGEPTGLEGQRLRWVGIGDLNAAELLPADAPLLAALQSAR